MWTPLDATPNDHNSFSRPVLGRLKPGVTVQQAKAEFDAWVRHLPLERGERNNEMLAETLPLKDLLVGDIRTSLLIFAGAVAFVLLIACANVANLLLMRAASRQQEIAVRGALGAGRWRLIRQLLTESSLVALAAGAAGLILARLGVPLLLAMAPGGKIPRMEQIHFDGWVLAFTFGVAALTGIAFGLAPAFQATRNPLRAGLNAGGRTNTVRSEGLRSVLVVLEIAMALVLLTGAGLMLKSFARMRSVNPGFRAGNVLTMTVDLPDSVYRTTHEIKAFHARTLDKLANLPGVAAVGAVNWMPFAGALTTGTFQIEGRPSSSHGWADKPGVSSGYFRAMGIPLLQGRYFTDQDSASAPGVAIVSQSVARRLWPKEDPVGKRISMEDHPQAKDWLTIVGVVEDIRQSDLKLKPSASVYQPYTQVTRPFFLSHMSFLVRTPASPQSLAPAMRAVLKEVDKDQPLESVSTLEDVVGATIAEPRFQGRLLAIFWSGAGAGGHRQLWRLGLLGGRADPRDRDSNGARRRKMQFYAWCCGARWFWRWLASCWARRARWRSWARSRNSFSRLRLQTLQRLPLSPRCWRWWRSWPASCLPGVRPRWTPRLRCAASNPQARRPTPRNRTMAGLLHVSDRPWPTNSRWRPIPHLCRRLRTRGPGAGLSPAHAGSRFRPDSRTQGNPRSHQ